MTRSMMQAALLLCLAATAGPAWCAAPQEHRESDQARLERYEREKAKGIAAVEVGGEAVAARRIDLNGATGGWEVLVKVEGKEVQWKVVIDRDTWTVRRKDKVQAAPSE